MATLIDNLVRAVPTWQAACRHLEGQEHREDLNVLLEIHDPLTVTESDRLVINAVDEAYRSSGKGSSISTVMNTIFPAGLYRAHGRPDFYQRFMAVNRRTREGTPSWGTYAQRMIQPDRDAPYSDETNQLENLVTRLTRVARGEVNRYTAAYEIGVVEALEDGSDADTQCGDLPLYQPCRDGNRWKGGPCLSHLTFKVDREMRVHLTAMYRSHYYGERALGNLLGLGSLLNFVAQESGLSAGTLSCLSTFAHLDVIPLGGAANARKLFG